ncbi:zinc finger protein 770-like [Betta splendens]|uniref:Zinc finger protein 770-like n=1 Tax=Betta splendens TaxID=158456 RepID=A0A8M1HAC0_BETSP|nr:zinc finger protein 770-like [Betta splendens]
MWLCGSYAMDAMHREEADSANAHTSVFKPPIDGSVNSASVLDSHNNKVQAACGTGIQGINANKRKTILNHQCSKCLKAFCSPSKLQRHFLIHTGQKPYSCAVCLKRFTQKVHLKSHLKTATKCLRSPFNERQRPSLSHDKPRSSFQQPSSCPGNPSVELQLECKISVNSEQELKTKIKPDAGVKPDQWVNTSSSYQEQEEQFITEKDLKPYQCMLCSRSFRLEANLARHHKSHRNQKQLGKTSVQTSIREEISGPEARKPLRESSQADAAEMNIAIKPTNWSKTCSNYVPWQLMNSVGQRRKNINTTSKQQRNSFHQCQVCCKCFPSVSKLHRHMMTHTGERPFGCETCGKRFRQKTHLRVHCRAHLWSRYHKQRSLYINRPLSRMGGHCRTSGDCLLQEMLLHEKEAGTQACTDEIAVKHLDQISSIDIFCNNDKRDPKMKLLPHASKNSEGRLMNKESAVTVKWKHAVKSTQHPGNPRHRCFQCLKCFPCPSKLKRHEMVHAGVKPFKCRTCGKAFRQTSHLKVHERTHSETNPSLPQYPRTAVPSRKRFESMDSTRSDCDGAVSNRERVLTCTVSKTSVTKCLESNITATPRKQSKPHRCHVCNKYFQSPYKLSRHSLTHSGIRPYECTGCSKAFTQRSHLKVHEHRCRQLRILASNCTQMDFINTTHTQNICLKGLSDCTNFSADATRVQQRSRDNVGQCSFGDEGSNWLSGPELCLQEGNNESEQRKNCNKAADDSFSFPSALAYEIDKLVQNQGANSTPLHLYHHSACNAERHEEVITISDSDDSAVENQIQTDASGGYWCEPAIVFGGAKLTEGLRSQNDLNVHIQPKITESAGKNHCDQFVPSSKLKKYHPYRSEAL